MGAIAGITDMENKAVRSNLVERWEQRAYHFVTLKTNGNLYRTRFYYANHEQFGTCIYKYKDSGDCVLNLLPLQADHELARPELKNF